MKLVSYDGGFGRIEGDTVVPMGDDLLTFLARGKNDAHDRDPVPLAELTLRAPIPRRLQSSSDVSVRR